MKVKEYLKIAKAGQYIKVDTYSYFVESVYNYSKGYTCFILPYVNLIKLGDGTTTYKLINESMDYNIVITKNDILTNKKIMKKVMQKIKGLIRTEPEKSFIEVGFMDENENITEDGLEVLNYILWDKNKEKLKEYADKLKKDIK